MKKLYWRPAGVSRRALLLIALVATAALIAVETLPQVRRQPAYQEKLAATRLAQDCMNAIKDEKAKRRIPMDPQFDPASTGMIGVSISRVTSNTGYISAKLTSTNPNFAGVIVHMLKKAGVEEGDTVAVGVSGSFPALNVAAYSAIEVLKLRPVIIASASSSGWGANNEGYVWLDMERTLFERQLIGFRSNAATRGGIDDRGVGMSLAGRRMLDEAISRNSLTPLAPESLADSISRRLALYDKQDTGRPIKAYINVGGGSASVGTHVGKKLFRAGLNKRVPRGAELFDSVMLRFAQRDVPVLHISRIKIIAKRYALTEEPRVPIEAGEGKVFIRAEYNLWLAAGGLAAIFLALLGFIRLDLGARVLGSGRPEEPRGNPEPMI